MAMGSISYLLILVASLVFLCLYFSHDSVSCRVDNSGIDALNGYYVALSGSYRRVSAPTSEQETHWYDSFSWKVFPDVIALFQAKTRESNLMSDKRMLMVNGVWIMAKGSKVLYSTSIEEVNGDTSSTTPPQSLSIHHPPKYGWHDRDSPSTTEGIPQVVECSGKLDNSPDEIDYFPNPSSGIGTMYAHPVTSVILCVLCYYAYHLWSNRVEVSTVSYSYDSVINKGEYWRIFTASIAHFDVWHIGFNAMGLYSLGSLEPVYGSITYAYLSLALIVITILIVIGIQYIMIYRYAREDMLYSQAVGYSAVLFAWMVAMSVRQSEYCPIFLFPTFCIKTWYIPLPSFILQLFGMNKDSQGLPVNLGTFVLLVFTKIFIPRSSFIGHLAGIIIGYPLAWNALNWLTPLIAISLILLAWIISTKKFVWYFPSFDSPLANIQEFLSAQTVQHVYSHRHLSYALILLSLTIPIYFLGWEQLLTRLISSFLLWSSVQARRIDCYSESHAIKSECSQIVIYTTTFIFFLTLYDFTTLLTTASNIGYLLGSNYSLNLINYFLLFNAFLVFIEAAVVTASVLTMNDMLKCTDFIARMGLERKMVRRELIELRLLRDDSAVPFSGQSNRLDTSQTQARGGADV